MNRPGKERLSFHGLAIALALSIAACGSVSPGSGGAAISQAGSGSATLGWTPVTQNTDGGELTDLAGYRVFYGSSPSAMTTIVVLSDPNQNSYVVTNLSSGTWYFTVAAYTSGGILGVTSNVVSKTISSASE